MMLPTNGRGAARVVVAGMAIGLAAVLAAGCSNGDGGSPGTASGHRGLGDTAYWEAKFSSGWSDSVDYVVKKGEAAVGLLEKLLGSSNETVVSTAAMALNDLGEKGRPALPGLLGALERFPDQPDVVATLKRHYLVDAVPQLIAWLKGSDSKLQMQAAKLMNGKNLGEAGNQAIPVLLDIVQGSAPDKVKIEAFGAIGSFGIAAEEAAVPVLERIQAEGGPLKKYAHTAQERIRSARVMHEIRTGQR